MSTKKTSLYVGLSLAGALHAVPTTAQEAREVLEEIIVTAERREANAQEIPISIATLSADQMAASGIASTETLTVAVPSLNFQRQFQGGVPFLRGVGTQQRAPGTESPVAVYVDDVYVGATAGNVFSFNNIAQVEVLKGPQGTLFGRNATGGVIHVRTRAPEQEPAFEVGIGYGNYDTTSGNLYGNVPVTDTLAINLAAYGRDQRKGWGRNLITGEDIHLGSEWAVRGEALWTPTDATYVRLSLDLGRDTFDAGLNNTIPAGVVHTGGATFADYYDNRSATPDTATNEQSGIALKVSHEFPAITLTSISSYRDTTLDFTFDQDRSVPVIVQARSHQPTRAISQELQLLSPAESKLRWLVGAYYFDQKSGAMPLEIRGASQAPNAATVQAAQQQVKSKSVFADTTFGVLPDTRLTVGARYTKDDFDLDYSVQRISSAGVTTDVTAAIPCASCSVPGRQDSSFSKVTWRAVLDRDFTSGVMGYASASRGFKSGGYNTLSPNGAAVEPEVLDAYEVGLKSEWLDRRLRLNASAFYYDYTDLQVNVAVAGGSISINAASARIKGAELELQFVPIERLSLAASLSVIDSEYRKFPNGPQFVPRPAACNPVTPDGSGGVQLPGARTGGNLTCPADLSGKETVQTPELAGSLSATYTLPTSVGSFRFTGAWSHTDSYFAASDNRLEQDAYDVANASVMWTAPSDRWTVTVWGQNLTDERYASVMSEAGLGDTIGYAAPRMYGVNFGFRL